MKCQLRHSSGSRNPAFVYDSEIMDSGLSLEWQYWNYRSDRYLDADKAKAEWNGVGNDRWWYRFPMEMRHIRSSIRAKC